MKIVILAGGYGSRLSEETDVKPKPMLEIGGRPMLWHIMKLYGHYGFHDFIILLGYKGALVKEYFANYFLYQSDVTIDLASNSLKVHDSQSEPWKVTLLETGLDTMTGGRLLRAKPYLEDQTFMMTYGDGIANVNIQSLLAFHQSKQATVTLTSVQPEGRFGSVHFEDDCKVSSFAEKQRGDGGWINGGYFVCEPQVFDYLTDADNTVFERAPLEGIAKKGKLFAFQHNGFWRGVDTLRDKKQLNEMWSSGTPEWKIWT